MLPSVNKLPSWKVNQTGWLDPLYVADVPFADIRAVTVKALLRRSEPLPTDVKLFGSLHIHLHGRAGTHEIAIAISVVDTVYRRPVFVDTKSAGWEAGVFT